MQLNKLLLSIVLFFLGGCATGITVSPEQEREAIRLIDQGTVALRILDLERAEASFAMSLELSSSPAAVDGLGCVALVQGRHKTAEKLFKQNIRNFPEYIESYGNLALLFEIQGEPKLAKYFYEYAIKMKPESIRLRNNYAGVLLDLDSSNSRQSRAELYKAFSVSSHPLIDENIKKLERGKIWRQ